MRTDLVDKTCILVLILLLVSLAILSSHLSFPGLVLPFIVHFSLFSNEEVGEHAPYLLLVGRGIASKLENLSILQFAFQMQL